ncbi:hypothetical protein I79_002073 [Cricetulus griseus]|uniref:Uncharacterized protein n=1 Tax=Cricetulus griseus TaxID=10029 RepID=G3GWF2_CRIGR|nr:hypothetical protein I79_002073 [Cricetulus griseus]
MHWYHSPRSPLLECRVLPGVMMLGPQVSSVSAKPVGTRWESQAMSSTWSWCNSCFSPSVT